MPVWRGSKLAYLRLIRLSQIHIRNPSEYRLLVWTHFINCQIELPNLNPPKFNHDRIRNSRLSHITHLDHIWKAWRKNQKNRGKVNVSYYYQTSLLFERMERNVINKGFCFYDQDKHRPARSSQ